MYFSIHHKINLTLLIVSVSVATLIEALVKDNKYGLKTKNTILNVVLTSIIIYSVLYCIARYTNLHQGLEMYEGYKEHMTNSDSKDKEDKEDKEESKSDDENKEDTKEEFLFVSSKRPSTEKHQMDKKVKQKDDNEDEEQDERLIQRALHTDANGSERELLKSIKGELASLRMQIALDKETKRKIHEHEMEDDMEFVQRKIVNTKTPLEFENGWSILKQPGQWQFPAIFPPQCLKKDDTIPKFGAKPTYDVLGKPYSEYLSNDKFKQI